MKMLRKVK